MKIRLTERQYLKVITENKNPKVDRLLQKFFDDIRYLDVDEKLYYFFDVYDFDEKMMGVSNRLYEWFKYSLLSDIKIIDIATLSKYQNKINNLLELLTTKETKKIIDSNKNDLEKIKELSKLESIIPKYYESKILKELIDGLLFDSIQYLFKNYEPKEAIRQSSILSDHLGIYRMKNIVPLVKDFAEKNGLTIIPKHKGITFQKDEGSMVRDLINYMKDIPEIPKKTKRGFLDYIGSRYTGGQHSTFWSAVNKVGIIQKVGGGNNVTYELGPNYKAYEEGNVVAF
jgi:hypothetical protein